MNDTPKTGALRVWHIPQVPGKPFRVDVATLREAVLLLRALADYDLFQLRHREWCEWESPDGADIGSVVDTLFATAKEKTS